MIETIMKNDYNNLNEKLKNIFSPEEFFDLSEEAKEIFLNAKEVNDSIDWPFNYIIDEINYAIYPSWEANKILCNYAEELFDDLIYEVPKYWREYIDREQWLLVNTESDFEQWFKEFYDFRDLSSSFSDFYIFKGYE